VGAPNLGKQFWRLGKITEMSESDSNPQSHILSCPQCGSKQYYKAGLRYLSNGEAVQRHLCRGCGYRFSERLSPKSIYGAFQSDSLRQICVPEQKGAKNLAETETRTELALREGTQTSPASMQVLDYAWQLKKQGLAESTIRQRVYRLKHLVREGANLMDPDSVLTVLATNNWSESNKQIFIVAYQSFATTYDLRWKKPKTRVERKIPFIPSEELVDQLIAGCGKKMATFLQTLKDTAARTAEATKIKWSEINEEQCTIRINNPVKGSNARMVKVSPKTITMINNLPRTTEFVFNSTPQNMRNNFDKQRLRLIRTLQNPKLREIHLHTLRRWKATMEYHRTNNIKFVQNILGHKKLENTDVYTHLINFESDEWHVAHARNLEEENKLIEGGFEYVRYSEKDEVVIYRKRK
jgi:integrase